MSKRTDRNDARRIVQQQLARERRRKRTLLSSALAMVVLLAAGLVGWGVLAAQRDEAAAATTPAAAVDDGTGFAVGTGPVTVDVYEDFMCPICGEFEKQSAPALASLAAAGKVKVVYHPIAILDRYSTTGYSTRAAAAAAAAAQGGRFTEFHAALFAQQPKENSPGLSDDQLVDIGRSVGLGDDFAAAVRDGTYRGWAGTVTDTASARGITGTPSVLVAGKPLQNPMAPGALTGAVEAASA